MDFQSVSQKATKTTKAGEDDQRDSVCHREPGPDGRGVPADGFLCVLCGLCVKICFGSIDGGKVSGCSGVESSATCPRWRMRSCGAAVPC